CAEFDNLSNAKSPNQKLQDPSFGARNRHGLQARPKHARAHTRKIGIRQTKQLIDIFFSWFFDSHGMTLRPTSNLVTPAGDRDRTLELPVPASVLAIRRGDRIRINFAGFTENGPETAR